MWHVVEDGSQRLFVAGKANLTGKHSGLAYTIEEVTVEYKDKKLATVKVDIKPDPVFETAQAVLERLNHKPTKLEVAEDFLEEILVDGAKDKNVIEKLATQRRIKLATLRDAREKIGIKIEQTGKGKTRKSFWSLS